MIISKMRKINIIMSMHIIFMIINIGNVDF